MSGQVDLRMSRLARGLRNTYACAFEISQEQRENDLLTY